eukprot:1937104-Amphidinium_carterae.1
MNHARYSAPHGAEHIQIEPRSQSTQRMPQGAVHYGAKLLRTCQETNKKSDPLTQHGPGSIQPSVPHGATSIQSL